MLDLESVRKLVPAVSSVAYFNTGTEGPLPSPVAQAMQEAIGEDETRGRISAKRFGKMDAQLAECRALFGRLVNVTPECIALTGGTVDGVKAVLDGLRLASGDRVVTTNIEHPAALAPIERLVARHGIRLEMVDIAPKATDATIVEDFRRTVDGARLVLVSHVSYSTGRRLPIPEIAGVAHAAGVPVLVDGAQAVGAIPVDFTASGADFYAFPGQKWLMGPEGAGALAVNGEVKDMISGDVRELERSTASKPVWAGMRAALEWRASLSGEAELCARIAANTGDLRRKLAAIEGVEVLTPHNAAGIVSFTVDGRPEQEIVARLGATRIGVRDVPGAIRVSCGFFNTQDEFDALVETVSATVRKTEGEET